MMTFNEWWDAVKKEAKCQDAAELLGDKESHLEGFREGYTPEEEIDETLYSAAASM